METINFLLDFGGFYYSIHDESIENAIDIFCTDDNDNFDQQMYDNIVSK